MFLLIYVDAIILAGTPNAPFSRLSNSLHKEFPMEDLGLLHYFLGVEVHSIGSELIPTQSKYIHSLLD